MRHVFSADELHPLFEKRLFHGTGAIAPQTIILSSHGMDWRFASSEVCTLRDSSPRDDVVWQGYYGSGIYMAEKARYSDCQYAYEEDGERQLILGRAFVGKYRDFGQEKVRLVDAPPLTDDEPAIKACCVKGGPHPPTTTRDTRAQASAMYVFYEHYQVFPEYILSYRDHPEVP